MFIFSILCDPGVWGSDNHERYVEGTEARKVEILKELFEYDIRRDIFDSEILEPAQRYWPYSNISTDHGMCTLRVR